MIKFEFLKKLWCCVGERVKHEKRVDKDRKIWKADVSSASPSLERKEEFRDGGAYFELWGGGEAYKRAPEAPSLGVSRGILPQKISKLGNDTFVIFS